jgi:hypothetical protein
MVSMLNELEVSSAPDRNCRTWKNPVASPLDAVVHSISDPAAKWYYKPINNNRI